MVGRAAKAAKAHTKATKTATKTASPRKQGGIKVERHTPPAVTRPFIGQGWVADTVQERKKVLTFDAAAKHSSLSAVGAMTSKASLLNEVY